MLKKGLMAVTLLGAMTMANAQNVEDSAVVKETKVADKYRVQTNQFEDNWFVSANVGVQGLFADHSNSFNPDSPAMKEQLRRPSFAFDVNFGKWVSPVIGVRAGVSGYEVKGNRDLSHNHGIQGDHQDWNMYNSYEGFPMEGVTKAGMTSLKYLRGHIDVMFNFSNMICGYKKDRLYSAIPYASVGYAGSLNKPDLSRCLNKNYSKEDIEGTQSISASLGFLNRFHVTDRLDVNLDLSITALSDRFDAQHGGWGPFRSRYDGIATALVGVTYNFGKWYWDQSTITTRRVKDEVLSELRNHAGQLELANDDLRKQLEEALNREVNAENVCGMPLLVTFYIDRYKIRNNDRVNLGFLAEAIKANPNKVYKITGYADRGTGSVRRNIFLARKRAEVIYNCLVKEFGVSESQLIKESKGGVANMYYNDPRCSRAVLLQVNE